MEVYLMKTGRALSADDQIGEEALAKFKTGDRIKCIITRQQNPLFHRKMMALFNVGFKYWEPGKIDCKYGTPEKNFDRFRKDVTIMAGFYTINHRLDNTFRVEAKSLSYSKMVQRWESGDCAPQADTIGVMCDTFNLSTDWFFTQSKT